MSNKPIWEVHQALMSTALILSSKSNQQPQNKLFKSTEKYTKNYLYVHKKKKSLEDFMKDKFDVGQQYNIQKNQNNLRLPQKVSIPNKENNRDMPALPFSVLAVSLQEAC